MIIDVKVVELEGIEPSSRQAIKMFSTCLVFFGCRDEAG
jgi:hypothetical protein